MPTDPEVPNWPPKGQRLKAVLFLAGPTVSVVATLLAYTSAISWLTAIPFEIPFLGSIVYLLVCDKRHGSDPPNS
jgi:hypothetical protein